MRALLIYYMIEQLKYEDPEAYGIYGAYVSLVYATPILGGLIADKYLGQRNSIILGAVLMGLGHFAMAFEYKMIFFMALGFLIIGNGFFKPNISTLVGKFYSIDDPRKDSAFTLFYMGINAGALLAPVTCGVVGNIYGRHWGFTIAGIGMAIGLIVFLFGKFRNIYEDKGFPPASELISKPLFLGLNLKHLIYIGAFISVPIFSFLINFNLISKIILYGVIGGMLIYLIVLASEEEKIQKEKLWVIIVLFFFSTMFWTFFELAGSVIALFTDRNVDLKFSGHDIPAEIFQGVNP
ncbi:MAG: oligopeptide:H+ symporter, partial [Cytophagaceae bacterium]|nr:oligopeptide:H+ symporter [Cytophagaceae bacterium]